MSASGPTSPSAHDPQTGGQSSARPEKIAAAKVVIIGNSRFNTELLRYFCTNCWGFEVTAVELTGLAGVAAVARTRPELVLASLAVPDLDASELVGRLHQAAPAVKIIGLLSQCNEYLLHTLVAVECHGLLFDVEENLGSLADAIKQVRRGVRFVSIRILQGQAALHTAPTAFPKLLSRREQEVLVCVAHSMSNDEIGAQLGLSADTAACHRKKIMSKLNLHNTPQLIHYCIEKGFNSASLPRPDGAGSTP